MTSQIPHALSNHLSDPKLPLKGVTPDVDYSWEASLSTQVYGINVRLLVRRDVAGETRRDREGSTGSNRLIPATPSACVCVVVKTDWFLSVLLKTS